MMALPRFYEAEGQTLVELCAGSAAISLRWLRAKARPPLGYQGGKQGYADAILDALGMNPGDGVGNDIILCEPGPWGDAWEHWRTAGGRADTCARLEAWAGEDPRELWQRLRAAPVPRDLGERVATWAVLSFWKFGNKAVCVKNGRWLASFNPAAACREEYNARRIAEGAAPSFVDVSVVLSDLARRVRRLPDLSRVRVHRGPAQSLQPIPGAVVYIDPPYQDTTGYGHVFPRAEVLEVAERWRAAGCVIAVSEACVLPLDGWRALQLPRRKGARRTWSKQQEEWLTISP
jgi:16S rRNA G966 N2-methylase RsmD